MRILIVEDDTDLRESLKSRLESACFAVDCADNGDTGSFMGRTTNYDAILLDLYLPERNGSAVCTELRAAGKTAPILMMSVQGEVPSKVELLNLGADDYVTKPFSFDEVLARIRALVRRPRAVQPNVVRHGHITLDVLRQKVFLKDREEVYLTRKEFVLLEYLMRHEGIVVTRGMLLEHVWDGTLDLFTNTIETHILALRKKVERPGVPKVIHTISGRGYVFDAKK